MKRGGRSRPDGLLRFVLRTGTFPEERVPERGAGLHQAAEDLARQGWIVDADRKVLRAFAGGFLPRGADVGREVLGHVKDPVVGLVVVLLGSRLDADIRLHRERLDSARVAVVCCFETADDSHVFVSFWLLETALCDLADGAPRAGGFSERVIEFCCARNARTTAQGKIRH